MDVWVVAAAAGAGYVAQRLKNLTKGKDKRLDSLPDNLNIRQNVKGKSCPNGGLFPRKSFVEERESEQAREAASAAEKASISGYKDENSVTVENFTNNASSSSLTGFLSSKDFQVDWEHRVPSDIDEVFTSDSLPRPSSSEVGFSYGLGRSRSSLRCRRINRETIKTQTALESCLMAQLYNEHAKFEEYTYSLHPEKKPILRPFIVTDGSRIISSPARELSNGTTGKGKCKLRDDTYPPENNTVLGVRRLPNVVSGRNKKEQVLRRNGSAKMAHGNQNSPQGTSDMALIFNLGLTMGIISSFLANKQEMEKLNKLLKQTENLVQDLHEEIEMKDSLTVKELAVEDYESHDVHSDHRYFDDDLHALSREQNCGEENSSEEESLSKIEAELEAELERLESTINSSKLEGRLSSLSKLDDPDSTSDVYEGKLSYDLFGAKKSENYIRAGSGGTTPHSVNYAVSPRELSLRLHEVIQTRLEERVKELETALKYMGSEHTHPMGEHSGNRTQTFSSQESLGSRDAVIINLSGAALAAYNEAYEEFAKVSDSDGEDFQFGFENDNGVLNSHGGQNSGLNGNREMGFDRRMDEDVCSMPNDVCSSTDESEDDEMERMLIRQIVEKAKKGSPAVLKAHRALLF